jgi:DNA-binding XRE family transcriptional regulator
MADDTENAALPRAGAPEGTGPGPTARRIGLAAALAYDGETQQAIADRLGISRRTLVRWKRLPAWDVAYEAVSAFYRMQLERERRPVPVSRPPRPPRRRIVVYARGDPNPFDGPFGDDA